MQQIYDDHCVKVFLEKQLQLFPEPVAEDEEEAREFLDDCLAMICRGLKEVREYMEEEMDITGMTDAQILAAEEVFDLRDGRYLIVEG